MHRAIRTCLFIMCLSIGIAHSAENRGRAGETATQIRGVVEAFAKAWNAHDMQAFSRLFTPDADWVNIRGNRWRGADQIRDNHDAIHKRFYSRSQVDFSDVSIRMVAPDVAVVHAKETMAGTDVPKAAGISPESQMSLLVVRRGTQWLIASGHNTNVAPPPPGSTGADTDTRH